MRWWERYFHRCGRWKARLCWRFLRVQVKFAIYKGQQQRMALTAITSAWHTITPFFAADSAFPLAPTTMKCYDDTLLPHWKRSFNYSLIRTRRVVEQAFGRLKGRWKIVDKSSLRDPVFARRVALVCCALHNVCERHRCPFEESWLPDPTAYTDTSHITSSQTLGSAASIRNTVAKYVHRTHPCPWLCWYYNCYTDNIIILIVNNIHTTVATWLCYMYIMFTIRCNNNTRCCLQDCQLVFFVKKLFEQLCLKELALLHHCHLELLVLLLHLLGQLSLKLESVLFQLGLESVCLFLHAYLVLYNCFLCFFLNLGKLCRNFSLAFSFFSIMGVFFGGSASLSGAAVLQSMSTVMITGFSLLAAGVIVSFDDPGPRGGWSLKWW